MNEKSSRSRVSLELLARCMSRNLPPEESESDEANHDAHDDRDCGVHENRNVRCIAQEEGQSSRR